MDLCPILGLFRALFFSLQKSGVFWTSGNPVHSVEKERALQMTMQLAGQLASGHTSSGRTVFWLKQLG